MASTTQKAIKFLKENLDSVTQAQVARKFGLERSTISKALKAAEKRKHVCPTCHQAIRNEFRGL